jgi:hypothetical protein
LLNSISPRIVPVGVLQSAAGSATNVLATAIPSAASNIQSAAGSATNVLATAIPSATSNIQNAVGSIKTATSGKIESLIPRNCSFGIKKFCVGFKNYMNYNDLLLDISKIIPPEITNIAGDEIQVF